MMAAILNSAILDSAILHKTLTQTSSIWLKLIHSDSTWWWQPSWTLPCWIQTLPSWIQTPCYFLSDSLKNTLHSDSVTQTNSIWLKLDDGSHLEFCHLGFSHLSSFSHSAILHKKNFTQLQPSHSFWLNLMMAAILKSAILDSAILHKKNFTHSFWLNLMMAAILNSAMLDLNTAILIQTPCYLLSDSLKNTLPPLWLCLKLIPSD